MKKTKIICALAMFIAFLSSCKKDEFQAPLLSPTAPVTAHVMDTVDVQNIHNSADVLARLKDITPVEALPSLDTVPVLHIIVSSIGVNITKEATNIGSLRGEGDIAIGYTFVFQVDDLNAIVVNRLFDGTLVSFWGVLGGHGFIQMEPGYINVCPVPQHTPCWWELY